MLTGSEITSVVVPYHTKILRSNKISHFSPIIYLCKINCKKNVVFKVIQTLSISNARTLCQSTYLQAMETKQLKS